MDVNPSLMARSVAELTKSVEQRQAVIARLMRTLSPEERARLLAEYDESLQRFTDAVLSAFTKAPTGARASGGPGPRQERTEEGGLMTVANAVRHVLGSRSEPMPPHEIIAEVKALRPTTSDQRVYATLQWMWKKREIARVGSFKNYVYGIKDSDRVASDEDEACAQAPTNGVARTSSTQAKGGTA